MNLALKCGKLKILYNKGEGDREEGQSAPKMKCGKQ